MVRAVTKPQSRFVQKIEALVRRDQANPEIDFAQASLGQVFAWCNARLVATASQSSTAVNPLQKQR
jgi:hypothetical protein